MKVKQHKLMIALVLSGLVHGLLLLDDFNSDSDLQLSASRLHSIHLELVTPAGAAGGKRNQVHDDNVRNNFLATQEKVGEKKAPSRYEPAKQIVEVIPHEPLPDFAEDRYEQEKQASKQTDNQDQFMQLVYQAVNQHKRYPYMARRLGQQGKATLSFVMHPDGQVTDIVLVESSRYSVLDRAAHESITAIAPFVLAGDYLAYEKAFDIAVDFRIN